MPHETLIYFSLTLEYSPLLKYRDVQKFKFLRAESTLIMSGIEWMIVWFIIYNWSYLLNKG